MLERSLAAWNTNTNTMMRPSMLQGSKRTLAAAIPSTSGRAYHFRRCSILVPSSESRLTNQRRSSCFTAAFFDDEYKSQEPPRKPGSPRAQQSSKLKQPSWQTVAPVLGGLAIASLFGPLMLSLAAGFAAITFALTAGALAMTFFLPAAFVVGGSLGVAALLGSLSLIPFLSILGIGYVTYQVTRSNKLGAFEAKAKVRRLEKDEQMKQARWEQDQREYKARREQEELERVQKEELLEFDRRLKSRHQTPL